jgi:hypothetical protein
MGCKECRGAVYVTWRKKRCKKECGGVLYVSMAGRSSTYKCGGDSICEHDDRRTGLQGGLEVLYVNMTD